MFQTEPIFVTNLILGLGVNLTGINLIINWRYNMKKLIIGIAVLALLVSGTSVAFGRGVSGVEGEVTAYGHGKWTLGTE